MLYCEYAQDNGYKFVRVKSPDTDIFFILLHFALQLKEVTILFDTGTGKNKRPLNISAMAERLTQVYCSALLALHSFTGSDTTSAFKGIGKVRPMKALLKHPRFVPIFARLGDTWDVPEEDFTEWEAFLCIIYGKPRFSDVDDLRYHMIEEKCGDEGLDATKNVDMATLPPCRRTLKEKVKRCNYQVGIWKRARQQDPDVPNPAAGHGWTMGEDGMLVPLWSEELEVAIVPTELAELLEGDFESDDDDDEDEQFIPESEESVSTCLEESDSD